MIQYKEYSEELKECAKEFLIGEFQEPMDVCGEECYAMYGYREFLIKTAMNLLKGEWHDPNLEDKDEEDEFMVDDDGKFIG